MAALVRRSRAEHQQPRRYCVPVRQVRHALDGGIDAMPVPQPPHVQRQKGIRWQPQHAARAQPYRPEQRRVEAAGHDVDTGVAPARHALQCVALLSAQHQHAVGIDQQLLLQGEHCRSALLRRRRGQRDHIRHAQRAPQLLRRATGRQVAGVGDVVAAALAPCKARHETPELLDKLLHGFALRHAGRPGRHVDDAHIGPPIMDLGLLDAVAAGKDIDLAAERTQFGTELRHVKAEAVAIDTAIDGQRRSVRTDERNFEHGENSWLSCLEFHCGRSVPPA